MKWTEGLRQFCSAVSTDQPSPGGGSAAAGAAAVSASLLVMVCGLSAKARSQAAHWHEIDKTKSALLSLRDELISLSEKDAEAYDHVLDAMRKRKTAPESDAAEDVEHTLQHAAEIPARTAEACVAVLDLATQVADKGIGSASSDIGVAALLAEAAFKGAAMNVRINIKDIRDRALAERMLARLKADGEHVDLTMRQLLTKLGY